MNVTVLDKDIKAVKNAGFPFFIDGVHSPATLIISEDKLPELVRLIYRVRPQVIRDIVCEECPEHLGTYHTNEIERGHKHH